MTLAAESITFGYARRRAPILRDISATFRAGRIAAILGPNGAGKSTLLRVMLGLSPAWSGRVTLAGADVRSMRAHERARRLAYVPQRPDAVGGFSARQVIAMGRHALRVDPGAIDAAIARLDLGGIVDTPFARLSVGQQQRAALARALAQLDATRATDLSGTALLADEPFSAMDPRFVARSAAALREVASKGCAIVLVLHDATAALRLADDAALLGHDGTVAASGPAPSTIRPEALETLFGTPFERTGASAVLPALTGRDAPGADTLPDA
jgi:iron complex transport system ATP-binding protein